jgi:pimeloyl-ACP methyl ester carboxylesterase
VGGVNLFGHEVEEPIYEGGPEPTPEPTLDEKGLAEAYNAKSGTYYHPESKTLYVRGSQTARDWIDNATTIPFGDTARHNIYGKLKDSYADHLRAGRQVNTIVGHSAGAASALQFQKDLKDVGVSVHSRVYNSPTLDLMPRGVGGHAPERFRQAGDPVSFLDRGAKIGGFHLNPLKAHSYNHTHKPHHEHHAAHHAHK